MMALNLAELRKRHKAAERYADFLLSRKARRLKDAVGIGMNLRLILQGKQEEKSDA